MEKVHLPVTFSKTGWKILLWILLIFQNVPFRSGKLRFRPFGINAAHFADSPSRFCTSLVCYMCEINYFLYVIFPRSDLVLFSFRPIATLQVTTIKYLSLSPLLILSSFRPKFTLFWFWSQPITTHDICIQKLMYVSRTGYRESLCINYLDVRAPCAVSGCNVLLVKDPALKSSSLVFGDK